METFSAIDDLRLLRMLNLLHNDIKVNVHLKHFPARGDVLLRSRRPDNVERFIPIDLGR